MQIVERWLPRDKKNVFDTRPVKCVKKLILHDPGVNVSADRLIEYFRDPKNVRPGSYHDVIQDDTIFHLIPYSNRAIHAGTFETSEVWPEIADSGLQNAYSLGICIIRGHYHKPTIAAHLRKLCLLFDLDPFTDILCHYQISSKKTDPILLQDKTIYADLIREIAEGGLA
jgi:hypothetical protein